MSRSDIDYQRWRDEDGAGTDGKRALWFCGGEEGITWSEVRAHCDEAHEFGERYGRRRGLEDAEWILGETVENLRLAELDVVGRLVTESCPVPESSLAVLRTLEAVSHAFFARDGLT